MAANFIAHAEVEINASAEKVWEAITTPELIKLYLFGTDVTSEWKEGSTIEFKGTWEGKEYYDKGEILQLKKNRLLQHTYYSSFSKLPDEPQNYLNVSYELAEENGKTTLSLTLENNPNEQARVHAENNWKQVLAVLKDVVEKQPQMV